VFPSAPGDTRRPVGVYAVGDSRVNPDVPTQSCQQETCLDEADFGTVHLSAANALGTDQTFEGCSPLVCAVGTVQPRSAPVLRLVKFTMGAGQRLAALHTDTGSSRHSAERPGLAMALAQLRSGAVTAFVLDKGAHESAPDCQRSGTAAQRTGGVLQVVSDTPATGGEAVKFSPKSLVAVAQAVRPLGSCGGDEG
jgi:hypothetical protein